MAKLQISNMLPVAIGIFLLVLIYGTGVGRMARPSFDGSDTQNFEIALDGMAPRAEVGDIFWVDLAVHNPGVQGGMYVQCSILDQRAENDWLSLQAVELLNSPRDNCVPNEPYTQTARVVIPTEGNEDVRLQFIVPNMVGENQIPVLYCNAFEQCASAGDPMGDQNGGTIVRRLTLVTGDDNPENDNVAPTLMSPAGNYPCKLNMDCPNYLFGDIECYKGFCIDSANRPPVCGDDVCTAGETRNNCPADCDKSTDFHLLDWISDHKVLITLLAIALILVGIFGVYGRKNEVM